MEFAESGCPIFRATTPLSRGQLRSKGHGKLSIHYAADLETIETIFRIIVSANQLSISSWSYDMEGHAKKCVERFCELANKTTQQLYKVSAPCIDDHHFKEEDLKSVGELSQVCSQIVLKCLYLARIGRPDILWSVGKLARPITKLTNACDKRLNRLISYIHHTCEYKQYCFLVLLPNNVGWDCFKTPILQEILRTQNPLLEEHLRFWKSYICSNQLDV